MVPACPAESLYTGPLFLAAKRFAVLSGHPWFIVSAKYGVIPPGKVVAPYERTLLNMGESDLRAWQTMVTGQLEGLKGIRLVVLASKVYEQVAEGFQGEVEYPLRGMNLFERTAWLRDVENLRRFR